MERNDFEDCLAGVVYCPVDQLEMTSVEVPQGEASFCVSVEDESASFVSLLFWVEEVSRLLFR